VPSCLCSTFTTKKHCNLFYMTFPRKVGLFELMYEENPKLAIWSLMLMRHSDPCIALFSAMAYPQITRLELLTWTFGSATFFSEAFIFPFFFSQTFDETSVVTQIIS